MKVLSGIVAFILIINFCQSGVIDKVIARVNDDVITRSDLDGEMANELLENPLLIDSAEIQKTRKEKLEEMIDNLLILQAAKKDAEPVPEEVITVEVNKYLAELTSTAPKDIPFEMYLKQKGTSLEELKKKIKEVIENKYIVTRAVDRRVQKLLSSEDRKFDESKLKTRYRVSHILLKFPKQLTPEIESKIKIKALEIVAEIRKGKSFEDMAKEFSDDEANKFVGGDLGYFDEGTIPQQFKSVIPKLQVDEVSEPIRSDLGYHIIKLRDKITVEDLIYSEKYKEERKQWINELRKKAKIQVFDSN
jgi:parvulin-like peptidyl-prolyl isomerase